MPNRRLKALLLSVDLLASYHDAQALGIFDEVRDVERGEFRPAERAREHGKLPLA